MEFDGKVVLVTGAAGGIGEGLVRRWAGRGAHVVVADVDERGAEVAADVDGVFVRCDVRDPAASERAVATAVDRFGGLDVAVLNAGIATGFGLGEDFDVDRYRAVMGVNLDGVVYGVHAAIPALRARGGGHLLATASMAGLMPMPMDPLYGANKAAVVALVRALGPVLEGERIAVNAVCPSFADTGIITGVKDALESAGMPILTVEAVVDAFDRAVDSGRTGECWWVQSGRPSEPFAFRNPPGPRSPDGGRLSVEPLD
ncbi:SDR family NAD(P)-dependent oxidoreductase [Actinosynnema sp. NPDC020468]|uniref:SDR family NAD(P)-dependent oxidoreductase n=1 Tax=Actinosynnema sp. NPDC020468 TaxID=3154488 RepID=UPI0033D69D62